MTKKTLRQVRFYGILPFVNPTYTSLTNPPTKNLVGVDTNQGWVNNMSARVS